jgi:hypothetical protein
MPYPIDLCPVRLRLARPHGAKPETSPPKVNGNSRKARGSQPSWNRSRRHRNKRAVPVNHVLQPAIVYFKSKESASGPQHPVDFRKRAILRLARAQVMQDKHGDRRRKAAVGKWQSRGITLQDVTLRVALSLRERGRERVVVFEASDPRGPPAQLLSCRPGTCADLQQAFPQFRPRQNPRQQLPPRNLPPKRRGAKPILQRVHSLSPPMGSDLMRIFLGSTTTMHPRSKASCPSLCPRVVERSSISSTGTEGLAAPVSASRPPKSGSAETRIRPSIAARSRISSSRADPEPQSRT